MIPMAMATPNSPISVSSTIAVVKTLVDHLIFPPIIMTAPTSEMAAPNETIRAVRSPSLASFRMVMMSCDCVAPRERALSRIDRFTAVIDEMVIPDTIGKAIIV